MTRQEAVALGKTRWWKRCTPLQAAIFQVNEERWVSDDYDGDTIAALSTFSPLFPEGTNPFLIMLMSVSDEMRSVLNKQHPPCSLEDVLKLLTPEERNTFDTANELVTA